MEMEMDIQDDFTELIPRLPEDVAIECLTRLPYSAHRLTSLVCKRWHHLLQSQQFYHQRKLTARTHKLCCFIQAITPSLSLSKQHSTTNYGITLFDPLTQSWDRIDPVPKYPFGLPLFCQIASTDGKLFIIGGWNPLTWQAVKDVFMYELTTQRWTQCADMPSSRCFFAVGAMEEEEGGGRIMIAGGHDEKKNALKSCWIFDIKKNEWSELAEMSEERDECEGIVIGSEFWVVSGYETQSQGRFKDSADVFEFESSDSEKKGKGKGKGKGGGWKRVDGAWRTSRCPRSCVGVGGENGKLISWGEFDLVGICGVDLDDRVVITGSGYRGGGAGAGAGHEVFVAEKMSNGEIGELRKIQQVPHEFSGFVQSGCCLEI